MLAQPSRRPRLLVVQHEDGCPPDRLGDALERAGVELLACRPYAGDDVPESPAGVDGLLVLGGHMGAGDDDVAPWLPAVRALLRAAVRETVPTLGVCLGGRLLAAACGGVVRPAAQGLEAGVVRLQWLPVAAGDELFAGAGPAGPSMHHDEVVELPPGAVGLASTRACRHHAFRVGGCAWGVQFHPEVALTTFRAWAERAEREGAGRGAADRLVAELARCDTEVQASAERLAARFAALLQPTAPGRTRGTPGKAAAEGVAARR